MDRMAVSDARLHPEGTVRFDDFHVDDVPVREDAEIDGLVEASAEIFHERMCHVAQAPQARIRIGERMERDPRP